MRKISDIWIIAITEKRYLVGDSYNKSCIKKPADVMPLFVFGHTGRRRHLRELLDKKCRHKKGVMGLLRSNAEVLLNKMLLCDVDMTTFVPDKVCG